MLMTFFHSEELLFPPLLLFGADKCVTGNSLQTKENYNFSCMIVYQMQN